MVSRQVCRYFKHILLATSECQALHQMLTTHSFFSVWLIPVKYSIGRYFIVNILLICLESKNNRGEREGEREMIHLLVFVPELCSSWCWVRPKEGVVAEKHLLRGRASVGSRSPSRNLHLKQWQNSMPDIPMWNAALASRCSSHCTTAHALLILLLSLVQILPCFLLGTGS